MVSILGNKYAHWTVIEELDRKVRGGQGVVVQCECGRTKIDVKSNYIRGNYTEKCIKCHMKKVKIFPSCSYRS